MTGSLPDLPDVPSVSVLTLTYDHEDFIAAAIESVLAQDWPADRLQHVVINDGSTDGTSRVLDAYRSHVTVVEQENAGMTAAANRGMEQLTGDVIVLLDGDDVLLPGRFERQIGALREHPTAGVVYTDAELIDRDGVVLERSFIDAARLPRLSGRLRGRLLERNVASGGASMYRGCLKPAFHPLGTRAVWPDYWYAWRISGVAEIVHLPEVTYRYRSHGRNSTFGPQAQTPENVTKELPFRLEMLAEIERHEASAVELARGVVAARRLLDLAPPELLARLVPGTGARSGSRRWLASAEEALAAGDLHGAAFACTRAAAVDLAAPELLELLRALAPQLEGVAAPSTGRWVLDDHGARRSAVLVDAAALLASPALLDAYADRFDAAADVTLVIHAAPEDGQQRVDEVAALVAGRGLDGPDAPDMVLASEPAARRRALLASVDATLGAGPPGSVAPVFAADQLDALAALVQSRAGRAPQPAAAV